MQKDKLLEQAINQMICGIKRKNVSANVPLNSQMQSLLITLNAFCVDQVLQDTEVAKDPRKIMYKSTAELKTALVAMCLSTALIDYQTQVIYTKEYFEQHIVIIHSDASNMFIEFNEIDPNIVSSSINSEYVHDWMIYRDYRGRGITALINSKVNDSTLDGFSRGGESAYEFARFERKYFELMRKKENKNKERAQDTFRNSMVSQMAKQLAKEQIAHGDNPLELVNMLFNSKDYDKAIEKMLSVEHKPQSSFQIEHKKKK